jgi:nitrogen fixation/metabolism regulation signal transduction histidine kinase
MLNYDDYQMIKDLKQTNPRHYELLTKIADYALNAASVGCHDVKNHAGVISSYCQLLEMSNPELVDNPYFNKIKLNLNNLLKLLDDIAAFRYSFSNQELSECAVCELLNEGIEGVMSKYPDIKCEILSGIPDLTILCHRQHMAAAFSEILLNAAESCELKNIAADKEIKIYLSVADNRICLEFTDTGIGFDSLQASKALQPFTTDKKNHSGLGLAAAANIIWQHNGNITIGEKDSKTCVTVFLPFKFE